MHICVTQEGKTALMWAAYYGRVEIVMGLLAAGVDINCQDVVSVDLHVIWLMLSALTPYISITYVSAHMSYNMYSDSLNFDDM